MKSPHAAAVHVSGIKAASCRRSGRAAGRCVKYAQRASSGCRRTRRCPHCLSPRRSIASTPVRSIQLCAAPTRAGSIGMTGLRGGAWCCGCFDCSRHRCSAVGVPSAIHRRCPCCRCPCCSVPAVQVPAAGISASPFLLSGHPAAAISPYGFRAARRCCRRHQPVAQRRQPRGVAWRPMPIRLPSPARPCASRLRRASSPGLCRASGVRYCAVPAASGPAPACCASPSRVPCACRPICPVRCGCLARLRRAYVSVACPSGLCRSYVPCLRRFASSSPSFARRVATGATWRFISTGTYARAMR